MEQELIDRIRRRTTQVRDDVVLGIGDDAAVVSMPGACELVLAMDTMVQGTHFLPTTTAVDLGWKALAVNLSDLAAMGAQPAWAMLSLTLPNADLAYVDGFAEGFAKLARPYQLSLIGGDTTRGALCCSVAVHGFVPVGGALTRHHAAPGDVVLVTGTLGDAAAGLELLGAASEAGDLSMTPSQQHLVQRLLRPTPRVAAGRLLRPLATACVDISDGLLTDLGHICTSSGVGACLDATQVPRSSALRTIQGEDASLQLALRGGDDYELCCTVKPADVPQVRAMLVTLDCPLTPIGHIVAGSGVEVRAGDGREQVMTREAWSHFPDSVQDAEDEHAMGTGGMPSVTLI